MFVRTTVSSFSFSRAKNPLPLFSLLFSSLVCRFFAISALAFLSAAIFQQLSATPTTHTAILLPFRAESLPFSNLPECCHFSFRTASTKSSRAQLERKQDHCTHQPNNNSPPLSLPRFHPPGANCQTNPNMQEEEAVGRPRSLNAFVYVDEAAGSDENSGDHPSMPGVCVCVSALNKLQANADLWLPFLAHSHRYTPTPTHVHTTLLTPFVVVALFVCLFVCSLSWLIAPVATMGRARQLAHGTGGKCRGIKKMNDNEFQQQLLSRPDTPLPCGEIDCRPCLRAASKLLFCACVFCVRVSVCFV